MRLGKYCSFLRVLFQYFILSLCFLHKQTRKDKLNLRPSAQNSHCVLHSFTSLPPQTTHKDKLNLRPRCSEGKTLCSSNALRLRGGKAWKHDDKYSPPCWRYLSCQDETDGSNLTLFFFKGEASRQLLVEIDHEYSDGGFAMCVGSRCGPLPPVFAIDYENQLKPSESWLASGEASRNLWNGTCEALLLDSLHLSQPLGDWSASGASSSSSSSSSGTPVPPVPLYTPAPPDARLASASRSSAASTRTAHVLPPASLQALQLTNGFYGSRMLFAADGSVVWLSNSFANKSLVIAGSSAHVSHGSLRDGQLVWNHLVTGACISALDSLPQSFNTALIEP